MLVALSGANRDPARFGDPDGLDLGRDSSGHLAFGHGIHYCVGAPLARLEAEIAFAGLLDRFAGIWLAVPAESLRWRPSTLIHGLEALPVRLDPAGAAQSRLVVYRSDGTPDRNRSWSAGHDQHVRHDHQYRGRRLVRRLPAGRPGA